MVNENPANFGQAEPGVHAESESALDSAPGVQAEAQQPPHEGEAAAGGAEQGQNPGQNPENNNDPMQVIAALRAELERAQAEVQTQREQALRAVAEAENVRKRVQRDLENAHKFALERFVNELLPVKDSLELGLAAANDSANLQDLIEGTQMTLRMFSTAVEKFGVAEVAPVGEPFDPELHQAMTMREAEGHPSGTVLEVVQKGYLLNDRLVRPAMVVVSK